MATLAFTHCRDLARAGGLHYDEAWAGLFSHRIAREPDFWPIAAMSPYTSAWSHYVSAAFFKLFGTHLWVDRLSGVFLVALGVTGVCLALKSLRQPLAAALLPWIIAFFSAAVINHRFTIEINTFHVFCFGLLFWGFSQKYTRQERQLPRLFADGAIVSGALLGITSHILFLAPAFAGLIWAFLNETFLHDKRARWIAGVPIVLLMGFFLRIHLMIPEKDKSFALLFLGLLSLMGVVFPRLTSSVIRWARGVAWKPIRFAFFIAASIAGLFLLFFAEGSWAAAFFNGGQSHPAAMLWPLLALGLCAIAGGQELFQQYQQDSRLKAGLAWFALSILLTAVIATKPAPRYFEIPLILLAIFFAYLLSMTLTSTFFRKRLAIASILIWTIGGALQLELNYFKPTRAESVPEQSFRFLFFRDNSGDTLLKQALVRTLAQSGCRFENIATDDIRVLDALRFLSLGDWPTLDGSCQFGKRLFIQRKSQVGDPAQGSWDVGAFVIREIP
jgi:hypothetical protein